MKLDIHTSDDFRPVGDILALIGDKWTVVVIGALGDGKKRFNELKREIEGISQKTLAIKLRTLERDGIVLRTLYPVIPPRVEYELTTLGEQLLGPLENIAEFALMHQFQVERSRQQFDEGVVIEPIVTSSQPMRAFSPVARGTGRL